MGGVGKTKLVKKKTSGDIEQQSFISTYPFRNLPTDDGCDMDIRVSLARISD